MTGLMKRLNQKMVKGATICTGLLLFVVLFALAGSEAVRASQVVAGQSHHGEPFAFARDLRADFSHPCIHHALPDNHTPDNHTPDNHTGDSQRVVSGSHADNAGHKDHRCCPGSNHAHVTNIRRFQFEPFVLSVSPDQNAGLMSLHSIRRFNMFSLSGGFRTMNPQSDHPGSARYRFLNTVRILV